MELLDAMSRMFNAGKTATVRMDVDQGFYDTLDYKFDFPNKDMHAGKSLSYDVAVFPFHERVSDFVRVYGLPYCQGVVMYEIAKFIDAAATQDNSFDLTEVGTNLGDCSLFAHAY